MDVFGAVFLIDEVALIAEAVEEGISGFGIGDGEFDLFAGFVFGDGGGAFVSDSAAGACFADPDEATAGAEGGRVGFKNGVALKDAAVFDVEAGFAQAAPERAEFADGDFDFGFETLHKR